MKKIILILITTFGIFNGFAQQFPLQSQYQFNYSSINPAAVGEFEYLRMSASYRNQWVGFNTQNDQAIATQYVSFTKGFGLNGVGLTLLSDRTGGAYNTSGLKLSYSHKVVFEDSELYLGLSGGGTRVNISPLDDPLTFNNDIVPEASFGAYFKINDFKLGFSVPGILNANMEITESINNKIERHYYTMLSYTKKINDDWTVFPSVLIRSVENHNQYDANVNFKLRNKIWFGASYRSSPGEESGASEVFGPSFYLGVDLGRLFAIYSNDISSGSLSSYPTHELSFGYDFRPLTAEELEERRKKEEEEEKIQDLDNDGVVDSLDLCPNLAGPVEANGCPDFDKDGIPDRYDLCPQIPGSVEAGCPDLTEAEKKIIKEVISNLEFEVNSTKLKRISYQTLTQLATLLQKNTEMILEIHGFASSEGSSNYNLGLSARRSKSVEEYLLSKGVSQNQLITRFFGESSPISNNNTEFGRQKNRRVEMQVRFHLKDSKEVIKIENEYYDALKGINIVPDNDYSYQTETSNNTNISTSDDNVINSEFETEGNINSSIESINNNSKQLTTEEEYIVETEEIEEEINENLSNDKYILVVQVFSAIENAKKFIKNSSEDLNYKKSGGKFFVYVYSSTYRKDVEQFRSLYKNDSWIKNP